MPRTITVSVCVAALPPMPATIGMNTARIGSASIVPVNSPTTPAARNAVARLTPSHGRRFRSDSARRREHTLVARDAGQAIDVFGRLVLDDVDDVIHGDDADQLVLLVDDRNRQQVVGRDLPRDLFLVHVHAGADQVRGHDPLERRLGRDQQQAAQRHDADQVPALVDDVEIEDHLDVAVALQLGDGLAHRHVFAQREDIRVHDAAGRPLLVLEQVLDDLRLLRPHQIEHRGRQVLRQVIDQRRGVVGRDFLRELGDLLGRTGGEQRCAGLGAELRQRLHGQTAVSVGQQAEGGLAILVGKLAEDLREVGGVLLLQQVDQVGGGTNAQQSLD